MKPTQHIFFALLIAASPSACSQASNNSFTVQIKTKSLNTVFDNANTVIDNINGYIANLPTVQNAIMQGGLTTISAILIYRSGIILQKCIENLQEDKNPSDTAFLLGTAFGSSMLAMGATALWGAWQLR